MFTKGVLFDMKNSADLSYTLHISTHPMRRFSPTKNSDTNMGVMRFGMGFMGFSTRNALNHWVFHGLLNLKTRIFQKGVA